MANEVLTNNVSEEKINPLDNDLAAPKKWRYDASEGKLYMLFMEGSKSYVLISRAILEESRGLFRIATLENGREILLWTSNKTGALSVF